MSVVSVFVPMALAAGFAAKFLFVALNGGIACHAISLLAPAMGKIARPRTKMPGAVFQAVRVHFVFFTAMAARYINRWFSHCQNICVASMVVKKYFDIAVRRIEEAYKQPRLFDEPAPKPVQESML